MAASAFFSSTALVDARESNTTLPLESNVATLVNPAASNAFFTSGIFAFMGLTPRRNAA